MTQRPFKVLGIQQVAIGGPDKLRRDRRRSPELRPDRRPERTEPRWDRTLDVDRDGPAEAVLENPRRPTPVPRHDRIVQVVVGLHERVRAGVLSADRERVARIERKSEAGEGGERDRYDRQCRDEQPPEDVCTQRSPPTLKPRAYQRRCGRGARQPSSKGCRVRAFGR